MTTTNLPNTLHDVDAAKNYERFFVPVIGSPLAADLVSAAMLASGERVLDVACGTGIVARTAAEQVGPRGRIVGVDVSAEMLAVARMTAAASGYPSIQWYETAAEAMPLPDEAFDVALCQLALQFFADRSAALREIRRVLVAGGRAFGSVPAPTKFFGVLEQAVARHVGAAARGFIHQVFSLSDPAMLTGLVEAAGFQDVAVRVDTKTLRLPPPAEFMWQYLHSTPLAAAVAALDADHRTSLERDVVAGWTPWRTEDGMTYAQPILTASGRR